MLSCMFIKKGYERRVSAMKVYLATWIQEVSQQEALQKKEKAERLLSYYFILEADRSLTDYCKGLNWCAQCGVALPPNWITCSKCLVVRAEGP